MATVTCQVCGRSFSAPSQSAALAKYEKHTRGAHHGGGVDKLLHKYGL